MTAKVEDNGTITETAYCGPFVYDASGSTLSLKYIVTPEGRVVKNGSTWDFEYKLTDHLGNTRAVIHKGSNGLAEVIQEWHYYPFGMEMSGLTAGTSSNKYLYNGKELQTDFDLDWYDYGARFYDPALARWHSIDPLAEDYYSLSTYNYVANNPLKFIDPNGMSIDNYGVHQNGNVTLLEATEDNYDVLYAVDENGQKQDTNGDSQVSESDGQKVNDQSILPQLAENRGGNNGQYAIGSSLEDIGNIFLFASKNTNVEFGFSSFKQNKSDIYIVNTNHTIDHVSKPFKLGYSEFDLRYHLHSHPGMEAYGEWYDGTKGGSSGDMSKLGVYYNNWIAKGNNPSAFPKHGVFHKSTSTIYYYTPWKESIKGHTFK